MQYTWYLSEVSAEIENDHNSHDGKKWTAKRLVIRPSEANGVAHDYKQNKCGILVC